MRLCHCGIAAAMNIYVRLGMKAKSIIAGNLNGKFPYMAGKMAGIAVNQQKKRIRVYVKS
jgi:hypothetical protein